MDHDHLCPSFKRNFISSQPFLGNLQNSTNVLKDYSEALVDTVAKDVAHDLQEISKLADKRAAPLSYSSGSADFVTK